jgi:23S rRNA pseudouridine2604 synthase
MSNGIPILGTTTKKCMVEKKGRAIFRIILTQGLNRQIRRMCEYLGYNVVKLKRTRIMSIKLDDLAPGKWRYFSEAEMQEIETLLEESTNSYE